MPNLRFLHFIFFVFCFSCKQPSTARVDASLRDSLLDSYLKMVDSLSYYDTTTIDFKLLKAYHQNDTGRLKSVFADLKQTHFSLPWETDLDSCIKQEEFKDIKSNGAYRFNYSPSFCPYNTSLTIIKFKDSTVLRTLVYQYAWNGNACKIVEQSSRLVDSLGWEKFQDAIELADLWGLKQDNGRHGLDGSTLEAYGFKKGNSPWNPDKSTFVLRWSPGPSSLFECFTFLLKLSKTKSGCITVQ